MKVFFLLLQEKKIIINETFGILSIFLMQRMEIEPFFLRSKFVQDQSYKV
jgi:hypothetical protein